MSNIIRCDFNRTNRRRQLAEIEEMFLKVYETFINTSPDITEAQLDNILREVLPNDLERYAELEKEEQEWYMCKYWK